MLRTLKHLWLGLLLIAVASGILLWSDLGRRQHKQPALAHVPRVALFQFSSTSLIDDTVRGVVEGLARNGFVEGQTLKLERFNSSGDYSTANAIARDLVSGGYDQIVTISTPALQVMASANRDGKTPHVFGAVTDPYGSGVNITGSAPDQHPAHLVGIGTFQPVASAFAIAKKMCPQLRRVGVVWSPTEHNSEVCVQKARAACKAHGMELIEANASNPSEVSEALRSLLSRNVDAIWIGGDTVAIASTGAIIAASKAAHVPVFTNDPSDAARGALFSIGASYPEVGRTIADISARLLKGTDPRTIGVANVVPESFTFSKESLAFFTGRWSITPELLARVDTPSGTPAPATPANKTPWQLRLVAYNQTTMSEDCQLGLKDGLVKCGLVEGRDFVLHVLNAQGDMSTLSSIMSSVRADQVDLLMTISSPTLQAALRQAGNTKIVFTGVGDGVQAGAGKSESDHLPNVTGVTTRSAFEGMAKLVREVMPRARRVGSIFTPSEINSVLYKDWLAEALKRVDIELVAVPVTSSAETAEATTALCRERIDAVCQIVDNTTRPGFAQIARKATEAGLPLFCFETSQIKSGAVLSLARDYYQAGLEAGEVAVRVLRGESPAGIPFANTRSETLTVYPEAAARLGLTLPAGVVQRAQVFTPAKPEKSAPKK